MLHFTTGTIGEVAGAAGIQLTRDRVAINGAHLRAGVAESFLFGAPKGFVGYGLPGTFETAVDAARKGNGMIALEELSKADPAARAKLLEAAMADDVKDITFLASMR